MRINVKFENNYKCITGREVSFIQLLELLKILMKFKSILLVVVVLLFSACSVWPRYHYEEAKALAPNAKEYLLKSIDNLTNEETKFIKETEPEIGHANYVFYYYWWKRPDGKVLFKVETSSPTIGFSPYGAYRLSE